jgi:asparagine synthase (glutamine-hydrolysing)
MRGRYLCLVGEPSAMFTDREPSPLKRVASWEKFSLYADQPLGRDLYVDGRFACIGTAFERHGPGGFTALVDVPDDIGVFGGRYWGGYVAILANHDGIAVYRDAGGHMPCYFARLPGGAALASDAKLLADLPTFRARIDWAQIEEGLLFPGHFTQRTALQGMDELLPGHILMLRHGSLGTEAFWLPRPSSNSYPIPSYQESIRKVEDAIAQVHRSIAAAFPKAIVTVSGGLDSSIVADAYARRGGNATLLTFYTDDPVGDERQFARFLADGSNSKLVERPYVAYPFRHRDDEVAFLPRATHRFLGNSINDRLVETARSASAPVILNGYGGDNVFGTTSSIRPLVDHIMSADPLGVATVTLRDLQTLTGASHFALLAELTRYVLRTRRRIRKRPLSRDVRFLTQSVARQMRPDTYHPWIDATRDAPAGGRAHVASLIRAFDHLEQFDRSAQVANISPLLMTPIVEACLAVPSWRWIKGGRDRAVARDASRTLPRSLLDRRHKGTPISLHAGHFADHRQEIRDYLADGILASNGIIDGSSVWRYVENSGHLYDRDYLRLLELADAETWARSWTA